MVENHIKSHPNYIPTESEEEDDHPKLSPEGIKLIPQVFSMIEEKNRIGFAKEIYCLCS